MAPLTTNKALVLLSGGLDSTLALKMILDQGLDAEAVHFSTPFCNCDKCAVEKAGEDYDLKVHHLFMGQDFLDLLVDPPHGYGSHMNICIDCRIHMLLKAKILAEEIGANYFVTGEVLGQRPFSQRLPAMKLIEREAGLEGKILRPLSAKVLDETIVEQEGLVDREALKGISGRRRIEQMELAEEIGVFDYPCPSGGCLLTDPHFSKRLEEYLVHEGKPSVPDMMLLRLGRHFRISGSRVVVGRNIHENNVLGGVAESRGWGTLAVDDFMGPTAIVEDCDVGIVGKVAAITVRYSDAPKGDSVKLTFRHGTTESLESMAMSDEEIETYRI